jgi:hypothetical protein
MAALLQTIGQLGTGYQQARDTQTQEKNELALKQQVNQRQQEELGLRLKEYLLRAATARAGQTETLPGGPYLEPETKKWFQVQRTFDPEKNQSRYEKQYVGGTPEGVVKADDAIARAAAIHPAKVNPTSSTSPPESVTVWDPESNGGKGGEITITPSMPEWAKFASVAQPLWDSRVKGHGERFSEQKQLMGMRIAPFWGSPVSVTDMTTNQPITMTRRQFYEAQSKNPGKFGPVSAIDNLTAAATQFAEVDTSFNMLKDAIGNMSDQDFDSAGRIARALVLQVTGNEEDESIFKVWAASEVAQSMTPAQTTYINALVNAQESSLALRKMGGQQGASDLTRKAVIDLLPGAATPNIAVANQKLSMYSKEYNTLKRRIPKQILDQFGGDNSGGAKPDIVVTPEDMKP